MGNLALGVDGWDSLAVLAALSPEQLGALRLGTPSVLAALKKLELVPHRVPVPLTEGLLKSINAAANRPGLYIVTSLTVILSRTPIHVILTFS